MAVADKQPEKYFDKIASIFRALSHPLRLKIVRELSEQPRNVSWLHEKLGGSQANISKHLGILLEHSIVSRNKEGMENIYKLTGEETLELCCCAFKCIKSQIESDLDILNSIEENEEVF